MTTSRTIKRLQVLAASFMGLVTIVNVYNAIKIVQRKPYTGLLFGFGAGVAFCTLFLSIHLYGQYKKEIEHRKTINGLLKKDENKNENT